MKKSNVASAILVAVVVSILLTTGLVAARQSQDTTQNSNTSSSSGTTSGQTGGGSAIDSSDRKFMIEAGRGGMAEVEWARVALQRASSDAVKQFAQRMIDDHTKAGQELTQLASTKGVTLETALDNNHSNTLSKLQGLSGAEFDRAYLKEAGVKAHEKMEKLYMREADRGKDADAKAFASKTLPTVQEHLRMAREMMTGMSGKGTSGNMNSNSGRTVDSGAGTMGESQGSGVDTNPDKRTTQNSNMSNTNMSNSNMTNSNMSNSNMSNSNMADNSNMSGNSNTMNSNMSNSNMSGNDNTSGNSNMSNDNTMNSNGNSNTGNANGNSNTGNTNGNSNTPR